MKTFRMIGMVFVAAVIAFAFSACEKDGKDDYKDYPQLIVGKWFNFTPEASGFIYFQADGKLNHTLNGNNLVFNLYEGSDTYKVNAT